MSNNGTPAVIRGEILEAGLVAPELKNGYFRVNVSVLGSALEAYPRNPLGLKVVVIAADDYDAILKMQEEERDQAIAFMSQLEAIRNRGVILKGVCKHCGQPIRINGEGSWVHEDPDDDPSAPDYGWVSCPSMGEEVSTTSAEPLDG